MITRLDEKNKRAVNLYRPDSSFIIQFLSLIVAVVVVLLLFSLSNNNLITIASVH